jgi:DNA adenine methylase
MAALAPPFSWYGGKRYMLKHLLPLLPKHRQYVEPFFGSGRLFFAKEPALVETINDLDGGVIGFFRALRDNPEEMERLASLTPWSRQFYNECRMTWQQEEDPTRRAWMWWVVAEQSRCGKFGSGWSYNVVESYRGKAGVCSWSEGHVARFAPVAARLMDTQIECGPALQVIRAHARPGALFYLDPSYELGTRTGGAAYRHEMTRADHEELASAILDLPGRFVLSGYACDAYLPLEQAGWARVDFARDAPSSGAGRVRGQVAKPGQNDRTESVWLDPATAAEVLPAAQTRLQLEAAG